MATSGWIKPRWWWEIRWHFSKDLAWVIWIDLCLIGTAFCSWSWAGWSMLISYMMLPAPALSQQTMIPQSAGPSDNTVAYLVAAMSILALVIKWIMDWTQQRSKNQDTQYFRSPPQCPTELQFENWQLKLGVTITNSFSEAMRPYFDIQNRILKDIERRLEKIEEKHELDRRNE